MSQELERVYTINLGKALISQSQHRAVRAVNMIKEFARHHMKTEEVKIDEELAHIIWARGVRRPPRKIRVRMAKTDEGFILVTPYSEEEAPVVPDKETKKEAEKVAKEVSKKVAEKSETKLEESKEEAAKPEPTKEPEKKPEPTKEPEKDSKK